MRAMAIESSIAEVQHYVSKLKYVRRIIFHERGRDRNAKYELHVDDRTGAKATKDCDA